MKLRTYQSADADQICRWIQTEEEFYRWSADRYNTYPISGEDIDKNYASQLADGHFYPMTAIDDDGNAIGHFIIRYPDDRNRESVRFGFIIVNPSLREKGVEKKCCALEYGLQKKIWMSNESIWAFLQRTRRQGNVIRLWVFANTTGDCARCRSERGNVLTWNYMYNTCRTD